MYLKQVRMTNSINTREMLELCAWLHTKRKEKTLSMRGLGELLDKPHTYVQRVEQGERRLDVVEFTWYCQALGCDPIDGVKLILRKQRHTNLLATGDQKSDSPTSQSKPTIEDQP